VSAGLTIDWANFTPWASLGGGILIGLSTVMLIVFRGRIAGISGILGGLFQFSNTSQDHYGWRIAFVLGILVSSLVYSLFTAMPASQIDTGYPMLILAGLLVGFGTRMGSGCTSGHAVCGIGRASPRSMVATASFMVSGFVTAYVVYHLF